MSLARTAKNRVLIVADVPPIRDSLRTLLESFGFHVSAAESLGEAMLELKACKPDVVIADVCMRGGDGLELIGAMRDFQALAPVIGISSRDAREGFGGLMTARRLGACGVVANPFLGFEIIEAVDRAIAAPRSAAEVARVA
jgi:DNA-binding NtrC family response regulator